MDRIQAMSCGSILEPIGSRYGSVLVHTEDIFNLWQHEVVKLLQIGLPIDVPKKYGPMKLFLTNSIHTVSFSPEEGLS